MDLKDPSYIQLITGAVSASVIFVGKLFHKVYKQDKQKVDSNLKKVIIDLNKIEKELENFVLMSSKNALEVVSLREKQESFKDDQHEIRVRISRLEESVTDLRKDLYVGIGEIKNLIIQNRSYK